MHLHGQWRQDSLAPHPIAYTSAAWLAIALWFILLSYLRVAAYRSASHRRLCLIRIAASSNICLRCRAWSAFLMSCATVLRSIVLVRSAAMAFLVLSAVAESGIQPHRTPSSKSFRSRSINSDCLVPGSGHGTGPERLTVVGVDKLLFEAGSALDDPFCREGFDDIFRLVFGVKAMHEVSWTDPAFHDSRQLLPRYSYHRWVLQAPSWRGSDRGVTAKPK